MNKTLIINQLLGRISYFHTLFIEPDAQPVHGAGKPCCDHPAPPRELGPWSVLQEISESLGTARTCGVGQLGCCSICRVRAYATTIVSCWAEAETRAHARTPDNEAITRTAMAGGDLLANTYMSQQGAHCRAARTPELFSLGLPLTDELLSLWRSPGRTPVVSRLNH